MENKLKLLNFENLKNAILLAINKYFISTCISIILTIIILYIISVESSLWYGSTFIKTLWKLNLSLIITFFLSVWLYLVSKNFWMNFKKSSYLQLISISYFWIFYYYIFQYDYPIEVITHIFLNIFWIICFLFFAWYLKEVFNKNYEQNTYFKYFFQFWLTVFYAIVFWVVLNILWAISIFSIDALFDIKNSEKIFQYYATISCALFTPIYFLNKLENIVLDDSFEVNKFFSFILKFLWIPFIYIYFLILYAYSIKVLIHFWDWPKWIISWLIICFSIFWNILYILSYNVWENLLIKIFKKYFFIAVLPQTLMLFYAIFLRINQYDLTINRYFVVVFWIYLVISSLYFIFSKQKRLSFIPVLLSFLIIIIWIWPWSVTNLSFSRQYNILIKDLEKNNILNNWKITLPTKEFEAKEALNLYTKIQYVCDFNNCEKIKSLFKNELENYRNDCYIKKWWEYNNCDYSYSYNVTYALSDILKLNKKYDYSGDYKYEWKFITLRNENIFPMKINWYDQILEINKRVFNIDISTKNIKYYSGSTLLESFDFQDYLNELTKKYDNQTNNYWSISITDKNDLVKVFEGKKYIIEFHFSNFSIKNPNYNIKEENNYSDTWYYEWYALIKQK